MLDTTEIENMGILKDIISSKRYSIFKFVVRVSDTFNGNRKGEVFSFGNLDADSMDQVNILVNSDYVTLHRVGDGAREHKYDFKPRELNYTLEQKIISVFKVWEDYYD